MLDIVMGVEGTPIGEAPMPDKDAGEDFGADPIADSAGDPCKCACRGVDSKEGAIAIVGDVREEELTDGASLAED